MASPDTQKQQAAAANEALQAATPSVPPRDWRRTAVTGVAVSSTLLGAAALLNSCDYPGVKTVANVPNGQNPDGGGAPATGPSAPEPTATLTPEQQVAATGAHIQQVWSERTSNPNLDPQLLATLRQLQGEPAQTQVSTFTGNNATIARIFVPVYVFGEKPSQNIEEYAPNSPKGQPMVSGYSLNCAFFRGDTLYFFNTGILQRGPAEFQSTNNSAKQLFKYVSNDQFLKDLNLIQSDGTVSGLMRLGMDVPATQADYQKANATGFIAPQDKFDFGQWIMGIKGAQQPDTTVVSTDPSMLEHVFGSGLVAPIYAYN